MKHIILIAGLVIAVLAAVLLISNSRPETADEKNEEVQNGSVTEDTEYGFKYSLPSGSDRYVVVAPEEGIRGDLVFTQSIFDAKEHAAMTRSAVPGESPASLAIEVFRNPMNTDLEEWIRQNERSNYALSVDGVISKKQLGGTQYTTYQYDGLYRTDVYAYAQEGYVYLFSNMWSDAESPMKKDMEELLSSVEWSVPQVSAQVAHGDIVVSAPVFGDEIESPLIVEGMARGTWFFEASFPMSLVDWNGRIIAQGIAQAQGEWMTEALVPWTGEIVFTKPDFDERGYLILQKDNPSGLPEHDDSIEIPIIFK